MLITDKQMTEISRRFNERYEALTVVRLRGKYGRWAEDLGEEGVRNFVSEGVRRAEKYRIVDSQDVTAFLEYCVVLGSGFEGTEEHDWAAGILHVRNLSGTEKIGRMKEAYPLP